VGCLTVILGEEGGRFRAKLPLRLQTHFLRQRWADEATEQALTKAVLQAELEMVSLLHHSLHLLIANHNRVDRFPENRPLLCDLPKITNRDSKIRPNASTLANTECSITKALISLNFDLPSAIVRRRYGGQHRIKSEDNAFFATFG
jgi:hypothetical protein